jgi:hypothetical protein
LIESLGDIVCSLHHAQGDEESGFLGLASTKVDVFSRFGLKTGGYGFCGLTSKSLTQVSQFRPQNRQLWFGDLAYKITVMVS